jgi:hypothetical protein
LFNPFPQAKGKGPENEEAEAKSTFSSFGDFGTPKIYPPFTTFNNLTQPKQRHRSGGFPIFD